MNPGRRTPPAASARVRTKNAVDESLFGSASAKKPNVMPTLPPEGPVSVSYASSSGKLQRAADEATILSTRELDRIKSISRVLTREEELAMKKRVEEEKEKHMRESKQRKERMLKLAEETKKNAPPSNVEKEQMDEANSLLSKAQAQLDEELDDVKHMNQMMLYAKCVTIRDAQLEEKKLVVSERGVEESRLDRIMEIERLKALRMYEEREAERAEKQRRGAEIIRQQIADRERERLHQLELQEIERHQILSNIEQLKKEEKEKMVQQREEGRRLLEEVAAANAEQIRRKAILAQQEKEEEKRISQYLAMKDKKETERLEEEERKRAEKEREVARLRAMQEKAQDTRAEEDALRAKRAIEEKERDWRRKERDDRERELRMQAEMADARQAQRLEKERRLAEEARAQREEFERILKVQAAERADEENRELEAQDRRLRNKDSLRTQIAEREEKRRRERQEFLEEGNKLRAQRDLERSKLERIKQKKLEELASLGVPEKYRTELQAKNIH